MKYRFIIICLNTLFSCCGWQSINLCSLLLSLQPLIKNQIRSGGIFLVFLISNGSIILFLRRHTYIISQYTVCHHITLCPLSSSSLFYSTFLQTKAPGCSLSLLCHSSISDFRGSTSSFCSHDILSHLRINVLFCVQEFGLGNSLYYSNRFCWHTNHI